MKALQLAVVLLIVCTCTALRCNRCVPAWVHGKCTATVETCQGNDDVCGYIINTLGNSHSRRCMTRLEAFLYESQVYSRVFTCTTDRCN